MAKSKQSNPEQFHLDIDAESSGPAVTKVGHRIRVLKHFARTDEKQYLEIDAADFWLPKAPFTEGPVRLSTRPDLVDAAFVAVRAYAARQEPSKSTHLNVAKGFRAIAKAFEYSWLHGYYSIKDWSPSFTDALPEILGKGGWALALDVSKRVEQLLEGGESERASTYVYRIRAGNIGFALSQKLQADIGSNIMQAELRPARDVLAKTLGLTLDNGQPLVHRTFKSSAANGMVDSLLRQELSWINLLSEVPASPPLSYTPFSSPVQLSKQFGRASGRTPNMTPAHVADILAEGLRWSEDGGDHVVRVLGHVVEALEFEVRAGRPATRTAALSALRASPGLSQLNGFVGREIADLRPHTHANKDETLEGAVENLVSGCFCLIALLNARRKDEVQHRKLGLMVDSTEVVDEALELHLCWFYIQKTHKAYVPFYIGRATVRAIRRLEELEQLTARLAAALNPSQKEVNRAERALFRMPNLWFTEKRGQANSYFAFGAGGASKRFLHRALGKTSAPERVIAHMFRRAYGLLFIYRFEGPLLALTQKYGHLDPTETMTYVVDPAQGGAGPAVRTYGRLSEEQIKAIAQEQHEVEQEILLVSNERLAEMVRDVIEGKTVGAGSFPVLIRRLHQRLASKSEYRLLSKDRKAAAVSDAFISKGHRFRPAWHGNCCAPRDSSVKKAACNPQGGSGIRQENAGPDTCAACHYHYLVEDHVRSIERYCDGLRRKLESARCGVIEQARLKSNIQNTEHVIFLHRKRLGGRGSEIY
ncbi:hypothetical protein [Roseateles flavus]|uniref:Tyr recombinase domain-containing protein n=1 Tax=Roseateles flavus TaxID=3149041 RepID=A0ABV0G8C8_9BURK